MSLLVLASSRSKYSRASVAEVLVTDQHDEGIVTMFGRKLTSVGGAERHLSFPHITLAPEHASGLEQVSASLEVLTTDKRRAEARIAQLDADARRDAHTRRSECRNRASSQFGCRK